MEINASTTPNKSLSEGMTRAHAKDVENIFTTENYLLNRHPDFFVYVYNVSEQDHIVSRPPIFVKMVIPGIRSVESNIDKVNGNPIKPYVLATRFPSPLVAPKASVDSSEVDYYATDTRRFAMDIVNPDNTTIDQDAALDPKFIFSKGNNLGARGVFWSLNGRGASKDANGNPTKNFEEPTKDELERAVARMEAGYLALLEEARGIEVSKPGELMSMLTPAHHAAAEYYQETLSWHGKKVKQENCENCGERVKQGSAFHKTDEGGLCIRNWERAVKAGVRTKAQAFEYTEDPKFAPQQPPTAPVAPVVSAA